MLATAAHLTNKMHCALGMSTFTIQSAKLRFLLHAAGGEGSSKAASTSAQVGQAPSRTHIPGAVSTCGDACSSGPKGRQKLINGG